MMSQFQEEKQDQKLESETQIVMWDCLICSRTSVFFLVNSHVRFNHTEIFKGGEAHINADLKQWQTFVVLTWPAYMMLSSLSRV